MFYFVAMSESKHIWNHDSISFSKNSEMFEHGIFRKTPKYTLWCALNIFFSDTQCLFFFAGPRWILEYLPLEKTGFQYYWSDSVFNEAEKFPAEQFRRQSHWKSPPSDKPRLFSPSLLTLLKLSQSTRATDFRHRHGALPRQQQQPNGL